MPVLLLHIDSATAVIKWAVLWTLSTGYRMTSMRWFSCGWWGGLSKNGLLFQWPLYIRGHTTLLDLHQDTTAPETCPQTEYIEYEEDALLNSVSRISKNAQDGMGIAALLNHLSENVTAWISSDYYMVVFVAIKEASPCKEASCLKTKR